MPQYFYSPNQGQLPCFYGSVISRRRPLLIRLDVPARHKHNSRISSLFPLKHVFFRTRHTDTWYERFYKGIECWYSVGEEEDSQNARVREKLLRNRNMRSPGVNRLNTINSRRRLAPAVKQSIEQTKHKHKKKTGTRAPLFLNRN